MPGGTARGGRAHREAGEASLGEQFDQSGVVQVADRRNLRPIPPGGYSGEECYQPLVELQLADGNLLFDVSLLEDDATWRLRRKLASFFHGLAFPLLNRMAKRRGTATSCGSASIRPGFRRTWWTPV